MQLLVDELGKKTGVFLSIREYEKLKALLEEVQDRNDLDFRLQNPDLIPFDEVEQALRVQD